MNLAKFDGYPATLHTSLSGEACYKRLQKEFDGMDSSWESAATDEKLLGWREGDTFIICPSWRFDAAAHPRHQWPTGRGGWDRSRIFRFQIRSTTEGASIKGRYVYAEGEGPLLLIVIGIPLGITFGVLIMLAGLTLAFQNLSALWLLAIGTFIFGICIFTILDSSDGGFPCERDYIVRYLARVLEAQPASGVGKVRGTRKTLQMVDPCSKLRAKIMLSAPMNAIFAMIHPLVISHGTTPPANAAMRA